jgi:hypothetical protein
MKINELLKKLNHIDKLSENSEKQFNNTVNSFINKDTEFNESIYNSLNENKKDYYIKCKQYKSFISQYSKAYREMADWYYGEELTYKDYCILFNKTNENNPLHNTYLNSKKDIIELYKLFLFYGMIEYFFKII